MVNTTYFTRDHTNQRYIMGDYGAPRFLLTEAAIDQPLSDFTQAAPTAPGSVSAQSANQSATVSWAASTVSGGGSISYVVTSNPGGLTCSTSSTSCLVTGLANGTSYTFSVVARVGSVNSAAVVSPAVIPSTATSGGNGSSNAGGASTVINPPSNPGGGAATRGVPGLAAGPVPGVFSGPVVAPGGARVIPSGPVTRFGGIPTPTQTTSTGSSIDVRSGGVNLGVRLRDSGSGGVVMNPQTNQPELRVSSGGSTRLSGGGLQPGSTVQVWLPGVLDRELGRVGVGPDGVFDGEVALAHRSGEAPLPIGRHVMQVTGFDENGVETVIEMPVRIAQPPPTPELNRQAGVLPDLGPRQSMATSAGIPTPVVVTPMAQQRSVFVDGGDWALTVSVNDPSSEVSGQENVPFIRIAQSSRGEVSGGGFMPGTLASVWFFSEPTLVGTVTVEEDGRFSLEFLVSPQSIPSGDHTLQIQGVGSDGFIKAANLGVLVEQPVELTTDSATGLLWWVAGTFVLALLLLFFVLFARRLRTREG